MYKFIFLLKFNIKISKLLLLVCSVDVNIWSHDRLSHQLELGCDDILLHLLQHDTG